MKKAVCYTDIHYPVGNVDDKMFSSFTEHLGRCIYSGIYEPGHPLADEDGFRTDVMDLVKELKGFSRIHLEPGEQKTVTFEVDEELLKFYNADLRHVAEPGEFTLMVGPNSEDLQSKTFVLE